MSTQSTLSETALDPKLVETLRIPTTVFRRSGDVGIRAAQIVAERIRQATPDRPFVLGLLTGSTPIRMYRELVRMHREEDLSFANVIVFMLDEYIGLEHDDPQSFRKFMRENLLDHIDLPSENFNIPDGALDPDEISLHCTRYEQKIDDAGGVDLWVVGIGSNGHIGFNEPGSERYSVTRVVDLHPSTLAGAASSFFGLENTPTRAITAGVGTIMGAGEILMLITGEGKANATRRLLEGEVSENFPASFLQEHENARVLLDYPACGELRGIKHPWLIGATEDWDNDGRVAAAVLWLAEEMERPIPRLTDADYRNLGLQQLLADRGDSRELNTRVHDLLQRALEPSVLSGAGVGEGRKVLAFEPHPDDNPIQMGGTLQRLGACRYEVHCATMTSGNIAVRDEVALHHVEHNLGAILEVLTSSEAESLRTHRHQLTTHLSCKLPRQLDGPQALALKRAIRELEVYAGLLELGVRRENSHFLRLPFYESGGISKKPIGDADVEIIVKLLREVRPNLIFAAGDLSDPHGTHRTCLQGLLMALDVVSDDDWAKNVEVYLYRGAWAEWPLQMADTLVGLSEEQFKRKLAAIRCHQSQVPCKINPEGAMFPGSDSRSFEERVIARNTGTAETLRKLGALNTDDGIHAVEAFVRLEKVRELLQV